MKAYKKSSSISNYITGTSSSDITFKKDEISTVEENIIGVMKNKNVVFIEKMYEGEKVSITRDSIIIYPQA